MGQAEVLKLLEEFGEPLSLKEIADKLQDAYWKVSKDLNKMLKYKEISCKEIPREIALSKYKSKRRMRLYYVEVECV